MQAKRRRLLQPIMNGYIPQGSIASITVSASPFTFTNTETWPIEVYINGVLTGLTVTRGNSAALTLAIGAAIVTLNPGESVTVTYTILPTMSYYPH